MHGTVAFVRAAQWLSPAIVKIPWRSKFAAKFFKNRKKPLDFLHRDYVYFRRAGRLLSALSAAIYRHLCRRAHRRGRCAALKKGGEAKKAKRLRARFACSIPRGAPYSFAILLR